MCKFLKTSRSLIYYYNKRKSKIIDKKSKTDIITIFKNSRNNYGSRKIKFELEKRGFKVSFKKNKKNYELRWISF